MTCLVVSLEFDFSPCSSKFLPKAHSNQKFNPSTYSIPTLSQELNKTVWTERRAWLQLTKEDYQIAVSKSAKLVPQVQPRADTSAWMYGSTALTGKVLYSGLTMPLSSSLPTTSETEKPLFAACFIPSPTASPPPGTIIHVGEAVTLHHAPNVEKLNRRSQKLKIGSVRSFNPKHRLSPPPWRLGSHRSSIRSLEPTPFVVKIFIGGRDNT